MRSVAGRGDHQAPTAARSALLNLMHSALELGIATNCMAPGDNDS
ncbi:hypothetical protein AB0G86_18735 [Streptomyces scabiei]